MAKKKNQSFPMPNDIGDNFEDDHNLLNFRPTINFVQPALTVPDPGPTRFEEDLISDEKNRIESLMSDFDDIITLTDLAQVRLDERVDALGGLTVTQDPIVDAATISAMKRLFPNEADTKHITYKQYQSCLDIIAKAGKEVETIGPLKIREAQENKTKTNFGVLALPAGMGRPEVMSSSSSISPIDMGAFQAIAVLAIFALLMPLIKTLILSEIAIHVATVKHM